MSLEAQLGSKCWQVISIASRLVNTGEKKYSTKEPKMLSGRCGVYQKLFYEKIGTVTDDKIILFLLSRNNKKNKNSGWTK